MFAGHGGVTSACVEAGLRVLPPIELRRGRHCDVTLPAVARMLVAWILSGAVWALVLAPPCTLWSRARGPPGLPGLVDPCALVLLRLLRAAKRAGVYVVVENPAASRLWAWPPLRKALAAMRADHAVLDMCCFDAAWRKPTRLSGTLPGLWTMAGRCPGHRRHVRLQGTVEHQGKRLWRTKFAAAYPPRFCRALAATLGHAAPSSGWARWNEAQPEHKWERSLAAAVNVPAPSGPVAAPRLAKRTVLGWEGSREQWGGEAVHVECRILREIFEFNRRHRAAQRAAQKEAG